MTVTPSASAAADEPFTPRFLVPLWPAPTPRTARPRESRSSDAMAAAVTAGWRVTRFVTHTATFGRLVCSATSVAATQGSMALPGVSATPIMSHPNRSAAAATRSVRSTVNGQKKNPISTAAVLITPGMGEPSASGLVEHHFTGFAQISTTLNLLTWVAARTTTLRLGTAVITLPWHNPVLLAEQVATIDLLSGGRVDFGIGQGYRHNEFAGLCQGS